MVQFRALLLGLLLCVAPEAMPQARASVKTAIVIHETESYWGLVSDVTSWHQARGWRTIGYHKLITNYYPTYDSFILKVHHPEYDGKVWQGRQDWEVGAHTKQDHVNEWGIGIALIGNFDVSYPTRKQWTALVNVCSLLCQKYHIDTSRIFYHRDFADKSCPGWRFPPRKVLCTVVHNRILWERRKSWGHRAS